MCLSTADDLSGGRLPTSMTLNDLEPQNRAFSEFFSRFQAATHTSRVNCADITGDRPGRAAYEIFSISADFNSAIFDPYV